MESSPEHVGLQPVSSVATFVSINTSNVGDIKDLQGVSQYDQVLDVQERLCRTFRWNFVIVKYSFSGNSPMYSGLTIVDSNQVWHACFKDFASNAERRLLRKRSAVVSDALKMSSINSSSEEKESGALRLWALSCEKQNWESIAANAKFYHASLQLFQLGNFNASSAAAAALWNIAHSDLTRPKLRVQSIWWRRVSGMLLRLHAATYQVVVSAGRKGKQSEVESEDDGPGHHFMPDINVDLEEYAPSVHAKLCKLGETIAAHSMDSVHAMMEGIYNDPLWIEVVEDSYSAMISSIHGLWMLAMDERCDTGVVRAIIKCMLIEDHAGDNILLGNSKMSFLQFIITALHMDVENVGSPFHPPRPHPAVHVCIMGLLSIIAQESPTLREMLVEEDVIRICTAALRRPAATASMESQSATEGSSSDGSRGALQSKLFFDCSEIMISKQDISGMADRKFESAAKLLHVLVQDENGVQKIIECGAVETLSLAFRRVRAYGSKIEAQSLVGTLVQIFVNKYPLNKDDLGSNLKAVVKAVMQILLDADRTLQSLACTAIWGLARNPFARELLSNLGATQATLSILASEMGHGRKQRRRAQGKMLLSERESRAEKKGQINMESLGKKKYALAQKAMGTLWILLFDRNALAGLLAFPMDGIRILVETVSVGVKSWKLVQLTVEALWLLTSTSNEVCDRLL
eukprot:g1874.t1